MVASPASEIDAVQLIERLTQIGIALSQEKNKDRVLEKILLEAKSIANADGGTLYFMDEAHELLHYAIVRTDSLNIAYGGHKQPAPEFKPIHLYDEVTGEPNYGTQVVHAILHRKPVNIPDVYDADGFDFEGTKKFDDAFSYRTKSVLTIPMISHRNQAIGCLQLINAQDMATGEVVAFSQNVQMLVQSLASQAAVIVDNKRLIAEQEALLESFIKVIAQAIDAKSPYTGGHCVRVPQLTEMIAAAACKATDGYMADFDLNEEEQYELHIAGWLHDCGKVVTPVHIMDKATKLETIYDRIDEVRARFEVLRKQARIAYLEECAEEGADKAALNAAYEAQIAELDDDEAFVVNANIGGEFMDDEDIARLETLGAQTWPYKGEERPLLSKEEIYNLSTRRGTITAEERQIMNDHMVHTVNMLEAMPWPKHLRRVPEYACGHHEKMDGTGYPKGVLAGTMSIPARMMAVADVFEALTASDRPYKKAKTLSEAMKIIGIFKENNHLDPEIVDFFVTSKVYLDYAKQFLSPELIDEVDEQAILNIVPKPMETKKPIS